MENLEVFTGLCHRAPRWSVRSWASLRPPQVHQLAVLSASSSRWSLCIRRRERRKRTLSCPLRGAQEHHRVPPIPSSERGDAEGSH